MLDESFHQSSLRRDRRQSTSGGRGAPIDNWRRAMVDVGDIARAEATSGAYGELDEDLYNAAVRRAYCDAMSRSNVPATFLEVAALSAHLRRPVTVIRGPVGAGDDAVVRRNGYQRRADVPGQVRVGGGRREVRGDWAAGVHAVLGARGGGADGVARRGFRVAGASEGGRRRPLRRPLRRGRGRREGDDDAAGRSRSLVREKAKEEPAVSRSLPRGARAGGGTGAARRRIDRHRRRRVRVRVGHARRRIGREQDGGVPPRVARGCVARGGGPCPGTPRCTARLAAAASG